MQEEFDDRLFQYYLEVGAIELSGIDQNGEMMFKVTEYAEEIAPELWNAHKDYVDNALIELYNKDLISVEYDENLQATISLTKEAEEIILGKGIIPFDDN